MVQETPEPAHALSGNGMRRGRKDAPGSTSGDSTQGTGEVSGTLRR